MARLPLQPSLLPSDGVLSRVAATTRSPPRLPRVYGLLLPRVLTVPAADHDGDGNDPALERVHRPRGLRIWLGVHAGVLRRIHGHVGVTNMAAGGKLTKEGVMDVIVPHQADRIKSSFLVNFMQRKDKKLGVPTLWCIPKVMFYLLE